MARSAYRTTAIMSIVAVWLSLPTRRVQGKFAVIVLPDTQNYSANKIYPDYPGGVAEIYRSQTEWIVENQQALNIQAVCHLGDIVDNGPDTAQWEVAHHAMSVLDEANIPYGTCLGNHDNHYGYGLTPFQKILILAQLRADLADYSKAPEI